MKRIVLFIFSYSLLISCRERILDISIPYEGDRLVINAFFSPDSLLKVNVKKTYPPTGKIIYIDGISNASVQVFENGILLEQLIYKNNGDYVSLKNKPKVGFTYSINVSSPDFPKIETEAEKIPEKPILNEVLFNEKIESLFNKGQESKKLSIKISDNSNSVSYYTVSTLGFYKNYQRPLNGFSIGNSGNINNPCNFFGNSIVGISSKCVSGNIIEFNYGYEMKPLWSSTNFVSAKPEKLNLIVSKISDSFYKYYNSKIDAEDLEKAFITSKPRFSNINGGYGIFATYNQVVLELPVN